MGEGDRVSGGRGWQVEIMRHTLSCTIPAAPPLVAGATTFAPAPLGERWVLGGVPHDFKGKRREAYSVPCIGESPAQPDKGGCGGPA